MPQPTSFLSQYPRLKSLITLIYHNIPQDVFSKLGYTTAKLIGPLNEAQSVADIISDVVATIRIINSLINEKNKIVLPDNKKSAPILHRLVLSISYVYADLMVELAKHDPEVLKHEKLKTIETIESSYKKFEGAPVHLKKFKELYPDTDYKMLFSLSKHRRDVSVLEATPLVSPILRVVNEPVAAAASPRPASPVAPSTPLQVPSPVAQPVPTITITPASPVAAAVDKTTDDVRVQCLKEIDGYVNGWSLRYLAKLWGGGPHNLSVAKEASDYLTAHPEINTKEAIASYLIKEIAPKTVRGGGFEAILSQYIPKEQMPTYVGDKKEEPVGEVASAATATP